MEGTLDLKSRTASNAGIALRAFPAKSRLIDHTTRHVKSGENDA